MKLKDLKPGMMVRWKDPDEGKCSRDLKVLSVQAMFEPKEKPSEEHAVRIKATDGWEAEVLLQELHPLQKYACKVYWEQSAEVEVWATDEEVASEVAMFQAEQEIGGLTIKQRLRPKPVVRLNEIVMVTDSVNCDPESDVQEIDAK